MTFDPRWLNQIPLHSIDGGEANSLVSMKGSLKLDVTDWDESVAIGNIAATGFNAISATKLRSGNALVAYGVTGDTNKAVVVNPSGSTVVSAVSFGGSGAGANNGYIKTATLSNGNAVVVYYDTDSRLKFVIYDEKLNVISSATISYTANCNAFSVGSLADGNFVVSYCDDNTKHAFQIFDESGDVVRTEVIVNTDEDDDSEVVGLQNGNFMLLTYDIFYIYYYIYDRKGNLVLGKTTLVSDAANGLLSDKSAVLLSNGHVAYGYYTKTNYYVAYGILDQYGNEIVAPTTVDSDAQMKSSTGSVISLPNNTFALTYSTDAATASYFQVRNNLGAVVKSKTAIGGTWTSVQSLVGTSFSNGELLFVGYDTAIKRTIWSGSKSVFGADLQTMGDFSLASGVAVNEISNAALASSATSLPTSAAVKLYVDQQTGNVPRNIIHEGDSRVEVQDSTAEVTQYITFVLNNAEIARMEDDGSAKTLTLGTSGDTSVNINTNTNQVSFLSGGTGVAEFLLDTQRLGVDNDTKVTTAQTTNTISFHSNNVLQGTFTPSGLTLASGDTVNQFSDDVALGGYNDATASSTIVPTQYAVRSYIDDIHELQSEPTGFPSVSRNTTQITFGDDATNQFKITPLAADYSFFIKGQRFVKDTTLTLNISDVEGAHFIYFDETGDLVETTTFSLDLLFTNAYVATVYWDATNKRHIYFGDERHGITMDGRTHINLHESQGTVYISGLALGDIVADGTGNSNIEAQLSVSSGTVLDEDIYHSIGAMAAPANIPMFYRTGSAPGLWRMEDADAFPVINTGSGRVAWNELTGGSWQLTEATEGNFVLTHIFSTNDLYQEVIGIVGQNQYATIAAAREGAADELNTLVTAGLPFQEFVAIGTVIFETSSSFTNTPKAIIRTTDGGADYVDWRFSKISSVPGTVTDHGALSGLGDDDHFQYAALAGTRAFTGLQGFNAGIDVNGGSLTLPTGAAINEFSTDGTLVGDSNTAVPTEQAVKTYVDTQIANLNPDKIWADDSKVEVVDDGTNTGYVQIVTDGVQVAYFDVLSSTQRIGKATESRLMVGDDTVVIYAGSTPVDILNLTTNAVRIGPEASWQSRIDVFGDSVTITGDYYKLFESQANNLYLGNRDGNKDYLHINVTTTIPFTFYTNDLERVSISDDGLKLQDGTRINEFSTDSLLGDTTSSNSVVSTQLAVKNYVDTQISGLAPNRIWQNLTEVVVTDDGTATPNVAILSDSEALALFTPTTFQVGNANGPAGTAFILGDTNGIKIIDVDSTDQIALFDSTGLQLATGVKINQFSDDDTLGDATPSDNIVPTQAAIKSYVDSQIGGQANRIWEGDSEVRVTDTGTGSIVTKADNTDVQSLTLNTQRVGQVASSRVELVVSPAPTIDLYAGTNKVFAGTTTSVVVGMTADTRMTLNQPSDLITFHTGNTDVGQLSLTTLRIGQAADSRLVLDTANDYADLYAGATQIIDGATETQIFGVSGDSHLFLDQNNNLADLYAGSTRILKGEEQLQILGTTGDSRIELDQLNDTADLYAGAIKVLSSTTNVLNLGVLADTYFSINQADNQINAYTNNTLQMQVENSGVSIEGDLTVRGNLSIDGTAFIVFNEEVKTEDNIITVNYGDPGPGVTRGIAGLEVDRGSEPIYQFIFQESSDTFRVGEVGDTQAVATREDDPDGYKVAWWNDDNRRFETLGDEYIKVDQTSNNIIFVTGLTQRGQFDSNGLTLQLGTSINEFSTDVTLAGDSDDAVPTEKAVKTYIDTQISGQSNIIFKNNSKVEVIDPTDATAAIDGSIQIVADDIQVAYFDAQEWTIRIGKDNRSKLQLMDGYFLGYVYDSVGDYVDTGINMTHTEQFFGRTGRAWAQFNTDIAGDGYYEALMYGGGTARIQIKDNESNNREVNIGHEYETEIRIQTYEGSERINFYVDTFPSMQLGAAGAPRVAHFGSLVGTRFNTDNASGSEIARVYAGPSGSADIVATFQKASQVLGVSGDTRLELNQTADTLNAYVSSTNIIEATTTAQRFGILNDCWINLDQAGNTVYVYAGNTQFISGNQTACTFGYPGDTNVIADKDQNLVYLQAGANVMGLIGVTSQRIGGSSDSRVLVDQSADNVTLYAANTLVATFGLTSQTIGGAADTRLFLDQSNNLADLYAGSTQIIDGAVNSQIFGVSGDSRLALDQTADTAQLYAGATLVFDGGTNVVTIGTAADTNIALNQSADTIVFESANATQLTIGTTGLTLSTGATINEFSTDGTLAGDADTVVPTEKAVKTYVDTEIDELRQELDLINVRNVYADTTASTGDVILADTTSGDITIQLLESTDGKIIIKKKSTDGNKVYITTTPGLIDGQTQIIIDTGYQAYTFVCDGTNFFII